MANAPHDAQPPGTIARQGHAGLAAADHAPAVRYNPDAPSEAWGWHGSWREFAPRGSRVLLWLGVALLLLANHSTHVSHVEDFYLIGIAVLMAIWLVSREVSARKRRRARPPVRGGGPS